MGNSKSTLENVQKDELGETVNDKNKYEEEVTRLSSYRDELIAIVAKSQDAFEKQLSFISAGALALSVGFIKDVVSNFTKSSYKKLLGWGWSLLVITLLLNCISHLVASYYHNKTVKEINEEDYEPERVIPRNKYIQRINWISIAAMIIGIGLILSFIIINTII